MRFTANSDTPLRGPARIGGIPILRGGPLGTNHSETLLGGPVREAMATNHSETLLGGAVSEALSPNHSETLLGVPVREGVTANHSETLLVGV